MMLQELRLLFAEVPNQDASKEDYRHAIVDQNCLQKRSGKTRLLSARHLTTLYGLDPSLLLFRALRYFWSRDEAGQPLLALLCAYARDPLLRSSAPFVLDLAEGAVFHLEAMESFLDAPDPGHYSESTSESLTKNLSATWKDSGHLAGKAPKYRSRAVSTEGATAYALLLGYLTGARGSALFQTEYAHLLDCPEDRALLLAEIAAQRSWISFKRIGKLMEISFPLFLSVESGEKA